MDRGKYKSEALEVIHETVIDFYNAGLISEEEKEEFDRSCLMKENQEEEK